MMSCSRQNGATGFWTGKAAGRSSGGRWSWASAADTADMYSAELVRNDRRALREFARREEVVVATRVCFPTNPDDPSARGLSAGTSWTPSTLPAPAGYGLRGFLDPRWDYTTPIEETMEALPDVVKAGRRYIGASACTRGSSPAGVAERKGWTLHLHAESL